MSFIRQLDKSTIYISILLVALALVRIPVPAAHMRALFQLLMEMAVIAAAAVLIVARVNVWVGAFLVLCLISSVIPVFDKATYMARNAVFLGCLWYALIVRFTSKHPQYILNAICVISVANAVFAIMQSLHIDPFTIFTFGIIRGRYTPNMYSGFMANPNELSVLLSMSFPAFFRKHWIFCSPFLLWGLIVADSTGGVIALAVGMLCYFLIKYRKTRLKHVLSLS